MATEGAQLVVAVDPLAELGVGTGVEAALEKERVGLEEEHLGGLLAEEVETAREVDGGVTMGMAMQARASKEAEILGASLEVIAATVK